MVDPKTTIQEPESYYRQQLMLFKAWENEETEIENLNSENKYLEHKDEIEKNANKFNVILDQEIDEYIKRFKEETAERKKNEEDKYLLEANLEKEMYEEVLQDNDSDIKVRAFNTDNDKKGSKSCCSTKNR
jgi:hypothetical protein